MANVTYTGTATLGAPVNAYISNKNNIFAIIANPAVPSQTTTITFQLNPGLGPSTVIATVTANFVSPPWQLVPQPTIPITFAVWEIGQPTSLNAVAPNVVLATPTNQISESSSSRPLGSSTSTTLTISRSNVTPTNSAEPSSSATSTSTATQSNVSKGFTGGKLAGVVIGCVIAGLLLFGLLILLYRRRRASNSHQVVSEIPKISSNHKHNRENMPIDTGVTKAWEGRLPQPDSDKTIKQLTSRTLDEIEMFVEEFFATCPTTPSRPEIARKLSSFDSPHLREPITDLLCTKSNPMALIKHSIALFLLQKVDPFSEVPGCLLPKEFILLSNSQDSMQAQSKTRVLRANMQPDPAKSAEYIAQRDRLITDAVQLTESAFQPWASGDSKNRTSALHGIMIHVSELGIKLYSQPASFQWQWENHPASNTGGLTAANVAMLPGLYKITGQSAEPLDPPICIVKPREGDLNF